MSSTTVVTIEEEKPSGLMQKWKDHYHHKRTPKDLVMSNRFATTCFWYVMLSMLYSCVFYGIPFVHSDLDEWSVYCIKVLFVYGILTGTANWFCCRTVTSVYTPENERQSSGHSQDSYYQNGMTNGRTGLDNKSGRKCERCNHIMPTRCHHCPDCDKCILKRDHHCYMIGKCIGFRNERFFVVFTFYIAVYSFYGFYIVINYMNAHTFPRIQKLDLFLPVTFLRLLTGSLELHEFFMISHCYFLWWTGVLAVSYFGWEIMTISSGKTSHEFRRDLDVKCTASIGENFRSVFGEYWLLNLIFPMHFVFKQSGDGVHWPTVVYRSQEKCV